MTQPPADNTPGTGTTVNTTVAAIGFLAVALSLVARAFDPHQFAADLAAIAILSLSLRWPILMGFAMVALFVIVSANEAYRSPIIVFSAPFLAGFIAWSGKPRSAFGFALVSFFIAVTSPFTGQWVPYDISGSIIFAISNIAGLWAGVYLRRQRIQHLEKQRRLEQEMENRKEQLTRTLHDSVASTLTSVVMRAETLGLTEAANHRTKESAELIAEETRQAMQEVRHLLQVMKEDSDLDEPPISRTVADQISVTARLLRSHGFEVHGDEQARQINAEFPPGFEQAFAEIATNAIKYATPGSRIDLAVTKCDEGLCCTMVNSVSDRPASRYLSSGIGLRETRRLVARHGGTFHSGPDGGSWVVRFSVPRVLPGAHPKGWVL